MQFNRGFFSSIVFLTASLFAQTPNTIPHELTDFYKNLQEGFSTLEAGLSNRVEESSIADRFLKTLVSRQLKVESENKSKFTELFITPELKEKISSLIKKESPNNTKITVELLSEILKDSSHQFSNEEKVKLSALILVHEEKNLLGINEQEKAVESILKRYEKDPFFKDVVKSENKGIDRLTDLIGRALAHPESLDTLLNPVKEQIFESEKRKLTNLSSLTPLPKFSEALNNLESLQKKPEMPNSGSIKLGNHPISSSDQNGRLAPRSYAMGGQGGIPMGSVTPTPDVQDTPELKTCVEHVRQKRFNVELALPGALCASTPIAKDPALTKKSFSKNLKETCEVDLASATHCAEGIGNLNGRIITTKIGGVNVQARIVHYGAVDPYHGPSVENGNPDLLTLKIEIPCLEASKLEIARVPSPEEIQNLARKDSIPLVLQQNTAINASQEGNNQATIAATGVFERNLNQEMGNFLRFNTKSRFNNSSGMDLGRLSRSPGLVFDSNRIKSGDSGGAALSCKFDEDKKVKDVLYVGAISHITVRGDQDEGKEGGVASGKSLLALSRKAWGDERLATSRESNRSNLNNADSSSLTSILTRENDHN